jgi:hypothetical protein
MPRCGQCDTPLMGTGACLYCRAMAAEAKLAALSMWGEDEWMRKIASLVPDDEDARSRLTPIGFAHELSPGKSTFHVCARSQWRFQPEVLTVDPACAHIGTLLDIKVGNVSQIENPISLSLFSPSSWGSIEVMREVAGRMVWGVLGVAVDITLYIDATKPHYDILEEEARKALGMPVPTVFRAALWGRVVDQPSSAQPWIASGHLAAPVIRPAGPDQLNELRAVVEHADIVNKLRTSGGDRR